MWICHIKDWKWFKFKGLLGGYVVASIVTELKKGNETLTKKVSELENIIKEKDEIIKD